jgi:hypothetical protein
MTGLMRDELGAPKVVDRCTFQAELDALRVREKAHTRAGDAIAAARRRLPLVEVDGATPLIGERGEVTLLEAFEGAEFSFLTISCGTPATLRRSSARGAPGLHRRSAGVVNLSYSARVWVDWRRGIRNRQAAVTLRHLVITCHSR